ncbi:unnamed protein product [Brassica rapa subsp. narinosa]|nr:uncharacterized protein LOC106366473 [Brassica napus]
MTLRFVSFFYLVIMGNCMERWMQGEGEEGEIEARAKAKESFKLDGDDDDQDGGQGGTKVKIVLTRHELDMFLLQMNRNHEGNLMMTKDVMVELEKRIIKPTPSLSSSPSSMAWEPSLESIIECPEAQEMDR